MTQHPHSHSLSEKSVNTYLLDAESSIEMTRLLDQNRVLTKGMGGIFPEREDDDLAGISRILDIACGPGGWVHEVAHTYPYIEVVGIDISKNMINYARAYAQVRKLNNAHFQAMDALKPLDFPDASFDIINVRTICYFMLPARWPQFLVECKRILRPGGTIRITEGEAGFCNLPAFETIMTRANKAMQLAGRSFSPTGTQVGITPMLTPLLKKAGFQHIQKQAHAIDYSFGAEAHEGAYQDLKLMFQLSRDFWITVGAVKPEEFEPLCEQALAEMQSEDFCALAYMLTVWGEKIM